MAGKNESERRVQAHLARHHGVISLDQAVDLGLSARQVRRRVASGVWVPLQRRVYTPAGAEPSWATRLAAALCAAGPEAVASHASAAALWDLGPAPPRPQVTVPYPLDPRLRDAEVHRRRGPARRTARRRRLPVTDPVQTIVDLAAAAAVAARAGTEARAGAGGDTPPAAASLDALDHLVDLVLARRLVGATELIRGVERARRRGRAGPSALRPLLARRGLTDAPHPSVLESRTRRLLLEWGYPPLAAEVPVVGGRYRIDFLLAPAVALEVDGFAYHASPRARSADLARRNRIRAEGIHLIESDWITVCHQPGRLRDELDAAFDLLRLPRPQRSPVTPPQGGATGTTGAHRTMVPDPPQAGRSPS